MSTRDTRRAFDEIVGHLEAEDPSLARPVRMIPRRTLTAVIAVVAALTWAGLSVLMVAWGAPGVVLTCVVTAAAIGWGIRYDRRRTGASA